MGEIRDQYMYTGATGNSYLSISNLTQHINEWNNSESSIPYSLRIVSE